MLRSFVLFCLSLALTVFFTQPNVVAADDPQLAHMVFFAVQDKADAEKLVAACDKYLANHEGTVYYSAGIRVEELDRGVNDTDFDVALHIVFASKAHHDKYQTHKQHLKFIEENKELWSNVRVFDSYIKKKKSAQ